MTNDTGPAITPEKIEEWRALLAKATWRTNTRPACPKSSDDMCLVSAAVNALPALLDLAQSAISTQAETGWRPIETAPKKRDCRIDLWVRWSDGYEARVPDCCWAGGSFAWLRNDGTALTGKWFLDAGGSRYFDPLCEDEDSIRALFWRDPPAPPAKGGE